MAFQADEANVGSGEHPRVRRAMRLVTCRAAFKPERRMLEGERPALIAMALEAARFIGRETLEHRGPDGAVRIVAVHAGHGTLGNFVMERALELRPLVEMTTRAQFVRGVGLANHQRFV